jgi:hypothetical protein
MQDAGDDHCAGRGHHRLGQHLAAENSLQLSIRLSCPEQSDLDLLQFQQIDQVADGLRHARSLSTQPGISAALPVSGRRSGDADVEPQDPP